MPRTPEQNREYMRTYRANKKMEAAMILVTERPGLTLVPDEYVAGHMRALDENAALREEVRHLKEELAKRPTMNVEEGVVTLPRTPRKGDRITIITPGFSTRPFTPVPKKGHP